MNRENESTRGAERTNGFMVALSTR